MVTEIIKDEPVRNQWIITDEILYMHYWKFIPVPSAFYRRHLLKFDKKLTPNENWRIKKVARKS